jgi:hypothetical protein
MARPWLCAMILTMGCGAGAHGTEAELIRKVIVCLPTASVPPIHRSGDFGESPFLGQLSAKQCTRPLLEARLRRDHCPSKTYDIQVPAPNPSLGSKLLRLSFSTEPVCSRRVNIENVRCTTTTSLSKTKVVHPNRGDGKFTRLGRANRCGNLNFSKPCLKLPERVRRPWQNSGPSKRLDCCYWPASPRPIIRLRVCFQVYFNSRSALLELRRSDHPG